ncbi:MAG: hypothetical protein QFB86_00900 [Patescibacteria group bacterium]|nr:hypothetical protein [Patescibacteria group bacterium]
MIFDIYPDVHNMMLLSGAPFTEQPELDGDAVAPIYGSIGEVVKVEPVYEVIVPFDPDPNIAFTETIAFSRWAISGLKPTSEEYGSYYDQIVTAYRYENGVDDGLLIRRMREEEIASIKDQKLLRFGGGLMVRPLSVPNPEFMRMRIKPEPLQENVLKTY